MGIELPPDLFAPLAHNEDECVEKECRFCDPRGADVSTLRAQLAERDARIGECRKMLLSAADNYATMATLSVSDHHQNLRIAELLRKAASALAAAKGMIDD